MIKNKRVAFVFLIVILTLLGLQVQGQDYGLEAQHTWGESRYDFAYSLALFSNDLYLVGFTDSFGRNDAFITKFSLNPFQVLWSNRFTSTVGSRIFYDVLASSTGIYVTGSSYFHPTEQHPILIKFDSNGNLIWSRYVYFNNIILMRRYELGEALAITNFGSLVCISGYIYNDRYDSYGGYFACFDDSGNLNSAYSKFFYYSTVDSGVTFYPYGIASYSSNLFLVGITTSSVIPPFIARYDGTSLIMKSFPSSVRNITSIAIDNMGNLYITGQYINNVFLAKISPTLSIIYSKVIQLSGDNIGNSIVLDSSNNIYIAGRTTLGGNDDVLVIKLDNNGNPIWCKTWGSPGYENAHKIRVDSNNELHLAGSSASIGNSLNDISCSITNVSVSLSDVPFIYLLSLYSLTFNPSLTTFSGNLDNPKIIDALYLKISPIITTTVTTTLTSTITTVVSDTSTLTSTSTTTITSTLTSTSTITSTITDTLTSTIATSTVTIVVTQCSPLLLRINEIEKVNNVLKETKIINQILYSTLYIFISLTFLFSFMIIKNRKKWK